MDFYLELEKALYSSDINTKELIISQAIEFCQKNRIINNSFEPKVQNKPSCAKFCNIVAPKDLEKRDNLSSKEGLIALVHAIAHIEYSAIDLAIDAVYRFVDMPIGYKLDWLIVAQDEVRHFKMLSLILENLGAKYGDLSVHQGLFDMAKKTNNSAVERMAVIPRYFEAGGLDVNPKISTKLMPFKSKPFVQDILDALDIIYNEEIEHVSKGDRWFKYLCKKEKSNYLERYLQIIEKYNLKGRASQFNIEARKKAGFSCDELKSLGVNKCS